MQEYRGLTGSCKFHGILDLFIEYFDGKIDIARLLHGQPVSFQVARRDVGICGIQMRQKFLGCPGA